MGKTKIAYVSDSWNPLKVRSGGYGCTMCSPGCANCFASAMNKRLFKGRAYDYTYQPTDFYLDQRVAELPLHWRKPRSIFVCSMCDLFHENVLYEQQAAIFVVANTCPEHDFLLLTKRQQREVEIS